MAWNCMTMGCAARRLTVPFVLLLVVAAGGAGTAQNPAASIAIAAGHPSQLHVRGQTIRVRAGQTHIETLEIADGKRLARACVDGLCSGSWFDGVHRASFGINGTPLPERDVDDGAERTFAAIASTAFAEASFIAAGGIVTPLPARGDTGLRYAVTAPHGTELIAVADGQTHRLSAVELPDRSLYRKLIANTGGAQILYAERLYDQITSVGTALEPPSGPHVTLADASDLALLSRMVPVVECTLRGRRAKCLIDSGTTPSAITLDFAEQLGLEPHGGIEIGGLGSYLTGVIEAGPLRLGPASFERLSLAVIPRVRGADFDVIVGSDLLAAVRVSFDLQHASARIDGGDDTPAGGAPIALEFSAGLPYTNVRLGARTSESMLVDTGDADTLSIGYDEYREDPALFTPRSANSVRGLGGEPMDAVNGTLGRAEIGDVRIDDVSVSAVRGQHAGHLGFGFAARCGRLIIALKQREMECLAGPVTSK